MGYNGESKCLGDDCEYFQRYLESHPSIRTVGGYKGRMIAACALNRLTCQAELVIDQENTSDKDTLNAT